MPNQYLFRDFLPSKVSFLMAINLRIWNPHSERIWGVEQDHFYQIVVYDRFEGLHFLGRFWRPTSIFFATFYLLSVSFWMASNLRYWNPHSKRIWWIKQDHFYQIDVYDRFEGLHFLCWFWPQPVFFSRHLRPFQMYSFHCSSDAQPIFFSRLSPF